MPQETLTTNLCLALIVVLGVGCTKPAIQSRTAEPTTTQSMTTQETFTTFVTVHGALR